MSAEKIIPMPNNSRDGAKMPDCETKSDDPNGRIKHSAQVVALRGNAKPDQCIDGTQYPDDKTRAKKIQKAVSVVVPTRGRGELLNRCLEALSKQNLEACLYEIIVVDDGPHPETQSAVDKWSAQVASKNLEIFYIANNGPHGPAAARNRGWRAARASIIAFTDDDTLPTPGWLKNGLEAFDDTAHVLCGRVEMPLWSTPTDYERDARHLETAEFVTANCFCRKEVLDFMNGFDERFRFAWREDSDLHFRLLGLQANILYVPQAVVVHPIRPAPWAVSISQQKKILFDALLYKKHPLLYRQKIRATPRWDYYAIVVALLMTSLGVWYGNFLFTLACCAVWTLMTARFFMKRLRGTTKTISHIAEMMITSALIPPCAVFWRMVGAVRFRVLFL